MKSYDPQLMDGLFRLLTCKPVEFVFQHSLSIGVVAGVISLMPFRIKRLPHILIVFLVMLAVFYMYSLLNLSLKQLWYSEHIYFAVKLAGDYIIGCIIGFAIANFIQRIRGEHDHVSRN